MSTPTSLPPVLPPYVPTHAPLPNITPFTYRDGYTYLQRFEDLVKYVNRVVIPWVQDNYNELSQEFIDQVNKLIEEVNAALEAEHDFVVDAIADIVDNSIEAQDPLVAQLIADIDSLTRQAADLVYAPIDIVVVVDGKADKAYVDAQDAILDDKIDASVASLTTYVDSEIVEVGATISALETDLESQIAYKITRGPFASRPGADVAGVNSIYVATDIPEQYISDGTLWYVHGSGGNELGSAKFSGPRVDASSSTLVDVPALNLTFTAGARPIEVAYFGRLAMAAANTQAAIQIRFNGNNAFTITAQTGNNVDYWATVSGFTRISGLTPGTIHTISAAIYVPAPYVGTTRTDDGLIIVRTL